MATVYLNAVGAAVPRREVHGKFVAYAPRLLGGARDRRLFARMAEGAGIDRCQAAGRAQRAACACVRLCDWADRRLHPGPDMGTDETCMARVKDEIDPERGLAEDRRYSERAH